MTEQTRSRKRRKADQDAVELFDRVVDSCRRVIDLFDRPYELNIARDGLAKLSEFVSQLDAALQRSESADTVLLTTESKDQLDSLGTALWNKALGLKPLTKRDDTSASVLAAARTTAFQLICLGSVDPNSETARLQQLSLGTKCATALLDAAQPARAETLVTDLGTVANALANVDSLPNDAARKRIKCLLDFYCCRIRLTSARGLTPIAYWLRDKAKALLAHPSITKREIEKLALAAYETGMTLLRSSPSREPAQSSEKSLTQCNEASLEWLQLALELLERQGDGATLTLQVEVLKALAHALLTATPPRSRWQQAEEVLRQALARPTALRSGELAPRDGTLSRRLLKLVVARGGNVDEITVAFLSAASCPGTSAEGAYGLVATLELLPEQRPQGKLRVLCKLCEALATSQTDAERALLSQLVAAAFLQAADADCALLGQCLDRVLELLPHFRIQPAEAFASATCLWRFGEKAEKDRSFRSAADWYLLGTQDCFSELDPGTRTKLARKAIFSLVEAGDRPAAKLLLDSAIVQENLAKNHFLRFYALEREPAPSLEALDALLHAPDVQPDLLLWTHKIAVERGDQALAKRILRAIGTHVLDDATGGGASAQIDPLVLVRSLIRVLSADLKTETRDRTSLAEQVHEQLSIGTSTYNICAEHCHEWDTALAKAMFGVTAEIMSFLLDRGQLLDAETAQKLALCRLAYLVALTEEARACGDNAKRIHLFDAVLTTACNLLRSLASPPFALSAGVADVQGAALAVQVEALVETSKWTDLAELASTFETDASRSLSALKILVARAADRRSDCPHDVLSQILQRALAVLYARRDLDQTRLALWLRSIVSALLHRRALPEARKYVENAIHFLSQPESDYPPDEAEWMAATAWDEGVDCYAASAPAEGRQWCDLGIRVATVTNSLLAQQWHSELAQLEERFGQSQGEETDAHMADSTGHA
ncbi:hypothetical protein BMF94_4671 [Rhodotorula taiwanensis]|uniref:Protein ZIP4 homolog n=1 Tax=Rhodotorula taiwanensis TaxID=741276 RepID=A0A2S5B6F8_9BASI|nr:hypothetical protein BMF94_4671 [Rhodotorula taiwanensis]